MHRIDGPGATSDNRFTDGDVVGGVQATQVTDDWLNDVQEEMLSILAAAGITPVKGTQNQLATAIRQLQQKGSPSFALDTGTANTYVCAYVPAITSLGRAEGQVLRFKVKTTNGGASTFNDGGGALPLVGSDHAALKPGVLVANGEAWVQYNSSVGSGSYVLMASSGAESLGSPIPGPSPRIRCIVSSGASLAGWLDDAIVLADSTGRTVQINNFSASLSLGTVGIGGMDAGSAAANGYLLVYAAYNPTTKAYGVFAANETSSTPVPGQSGSFATYQGANRPAGYTYTALISVVPVSATSTLFAAFTQVGRKVKLSQTSLFSASTMTTTARSWQSLASTSIPYAATSIDGFLGVTSNYSGGTIVVIGGIAAVAEGPGQTQLLVSSANGTCSNDATFVEVPIHTSRTFSYFFYNSVSVSASVINGVLMNGFTF